MCTAVSSKVDLRPSAKSPRFARDKIKVTTIPKSDLYRLLTSVDELLKSADLAELLAREGQPAVTESVRAVLASLREQISMGTLGTQEAVLLAVTHLPQAVAQPPEPRDGIFTQAGHQRHGRDSAYKSWACAAGRIGYQAHR